MKPITLLLARGRRFAVSRKRGQRLEFREEALLHSLNSNLFRFVFFLRVPLWAVFLSVPYAASFTFFNVPCTFSSSVSGVNGFTT
jgi:hypothetical protein